jgi:glycosyltransferase involved in cell wall biosynthesis
MLAGLEEALDGVDVVHAAETFIPVSAQAADIAAARGIPLVLTCWENIPFLHDTEPDTAARKARLRGQAAVLVAVTPPARDALVAEGADADRIRVLPAALDVDRFEPGHDPAFLRSLTGIPEGDRIVLYVGRLIREKGVVELVRAFASVSANARAHLVVVGNGPEGGRIATAARALGVAERVHVLPGQSYADIPAVFRGADVVAIPSLSTPYWQEQFGFVLAEAMACGRPVVTTRTGSIPDVVGDAALLVDDYDVPALGAALSDLLADPVRAAALGAAGRSRVEERYTAAVVAPRLEAVYREASGR